MEGIIFDKKTFNKILRELYIIGLLKESPKKKDDILDELLHFYGEENEISMRTIERSLEKMTEFWGVEIDIDNIKGEKGKFLSIDFKGKEDVYKNILEILMTYIFKDNLIQQSLEPLIRSIENPFILFINIYKAIYDRRHITFDYYFENQDFLKEGMDLEPYDLVHRSGKWLLLGTSLKNPEKIVKQYFVHNIRNMKINYDEDPFEVKTHLYNKNEYYKYSWGLFKSNDVLDIEIWFSDKMANKIKSFPYHSSQEIKETDDGIIVKIKSCGYVEVVNWVLGFGKDAKIINPQICVDYLKQKLNETLKIYE